MAGKLTRDALMARAAGMTREELLGLVGDLATDFETANRIANTQATAFGWCAEYEDRVNKYNEEFIVLKMDGRGKRMGNVRNVFAARRLAMGHVMSTCGRLGIELPEGSPAGVVRDHKALDDAHDKLVEQLTSPDPAENPQPFAPPGTPNPL